MLHLFQGSCCIFNFSSMGCLCIAVSSETHVRYTLLMRNMLEGSMDSWHCVATKEVVGLQSLKLSRVLGPHLVDLLLWNLNMQKSECTLTSPPCTY